jgi:hypothetical protein
MSLFKEVTIKENDIKFDNNEIKIVKDIKSVEIWSSKYEYS